MDQQAAMTPTERHQATERAARKRFEDARDDARHASNHVNPWRWPTFTRDLQFGYMDPMATFEALSEQDRRAVLALAYFGALALP